MIDLDLDPDTLVDALRRVQERIRGDVLKATSGRSIDELAAVERDDDGDTIFRIDRVSESTLIDAVSECIACHTPVVLIAEGLASGSVVLPVGADAKDATLRIIADPIDGTRGLMFQKRSAWVLMGAAPNRGADTSLRDIAVAVMTELPLLKQHLSDQLWAVRGRGATGTRWNRLTGETTPLPLTPSAATDLRHGYASVARFFPGMRETLSALDDELIAVLHGPELPDKASCFEDQYACTGGQLYELIVGHDRFTADLRALLARHRRDHEKAAGLCCHPYDLCTSLIAEEAGVVVTSPDGPALDAPLELETDVSWVGYANATLRGLVEPVLQRLLCERGWIGAPHP